MIAQYLIKKVAELEAKISKTNHIKEKTQIKYQFNLN